jgi:hypothetical protein
MYGIIGKQKGIKMITYQEFKTLYINTFKTMVSYSPKEVGAQIYAEKLAKLSDDYPEWTELVESEI